MENLKGNNEDLTDKEFDVFALVKRLIYGMIGVNVIFVTIGFLTGTGQFSAGIVLGAVSGFLNLWSYYEQAIKVENAFINKSGKSRFARMFFFRYAINAAFMAISAYISLTSLLGCFCGILSLRLSIYIVSFFTKLKRG